LRRNWLYYVSLNHAELAFLFCYPWQGVEKEKNHSSSPLELNTLLKRWLLSSIFSLARLQGRQEREREQAVIYQQPASTTVLQNPTGLQPLSIKGLF
jgi:hypothetical protein